MILMAYKKRMTENKIGTKINTTAKMKRYGIEFNAKSVLHEKVIWDVTSGLLYTYIILKCGVRCCAYA